MKREGSSITALVLCVSLVACGGDDEDMGSTPTTVAETETSDEGTGAEPSTTSPTTTTNDPTTTTQDPSSTDTGDTGDDMPDDTSDDTSSAVRFDTHVLPIIEANCSCHRMDNPAGGLDMRSLGAYANLVDQPSNQDGSILRVAPGSAADSYLFQKLTDTHETNSNRMPPNNGFPLPQTNLDIIEQWIEEGAVK